MSVRSFAKVGLFLLVPLSLIAGCPTNLPAENAVTFGVKAAQGRLTAASSTEWQAFADKIDSRVPEDIALTDAQAGAVVDFVAANDLNTITEVVTLVEQVQQDPSVVDQLQIPDSVIMLFSQQLGQDVTIQDLLNAN